MHKPRPRVFRSPGLCPPWEQQLSRPRLPSTACLSPGGWGAFPVHQSRQNSDLSAGLARRGAAPTKQPASPASIPSLVLTEKSAALVYIHLGTSKQDKNPQDNLLKIRNSEKKPSDKDWVKNEGENADQCLPLCLTCVHSSRAWRGCCHPAIPVLEKLVSQHGPQTPAPLLDPTRCQRPESGCCPKPR